MNSDFGFLCYYALNVYEKHFARALMSLVSAPWCYPLTTKTARFVGCCCKALHRHDKEPTKKTTPLIKTMRFVGSYYKAPYRKMRNLPAIMVLAGRRLSNTLQITPLGSEVHWVCRVATL